MGFPDRTHLLAIHSVVIGGGDDHHHACVHGAPVGGGDTYGDSFTPL